MSSEEPEKQADAEEPAKDDEQVEQEKRQKEEEQRKKQKLKAGDYVVQVHLIEARDLKGRGIGDMSDPVCVVECMGQKQNSRVHKSNLSPVFEQVLYFEFKNLEPMQVEMGRVRVTVMDANTFRRNEMIGMFEFDVSSVYYNKHHEMFRQWVALTDITDKHEGIQGYLKLSIVVLGPDDEQYVHSAEEEDDEDEGMLSVMMPPQIEQVGRVLKIQVYKVDEIIQMDEGIFGGKADPYAKCLFAGVKVKTKHISGQSGNILQELHVPVMEPILGSSIIFSLYDWDQAGSDDRIGTTMFNYKSVKQDGFPVQWINFYGAPEGKQRGIASKMNRGYIEGTLFRGRALIGMTVEDCDEPKKDTVDCAATPEPKEEQYVIMFDLYEGSEVPDKDDVYVQVSCGSRYFSSPERSPRQGRATWYEPIKDDGEDIVVTVPADLDQAPDVFVYLCYKKKRLSYMRVPFKEAVEAGWKVPPTWHILREDRAGKYINPGEGEFPGVLLFSMRVGKYANKPKMTYPESRPLNDGGVFMHYNEPAKVEEVAPLEEEVPTVGTLKLTVIGGRDLPIMDRKSSDPYVKVRMGNYKFETAVIKESLNPEWNETFTFENVPIHSNLELKVRDKDIVGKDESMGEALIDLRTQQSQSMSKPGRDFTVDNWILVNDEYPNAAVHLKFEFKFLSLAASKAAEGSAAKNKDPKRRISLNPFKKKRDGPQRGKGTLGEPEWAQFQLRAHIYQARQLRATDASGLADPYVVVRLAGKTIKTFRKDETLNPQWYKSYSVNCELPIPLSLAPHIQVYVFDWDRIGSDDPLGKFDVTIEEAIGNVEVRPTWYQIRDFENREITNCKMLACFQLLEARAAAAPLPDISPPTVPMFIEITTLGLRGLTSLLGVHKTYIEFELPNGKRFKTEKSSVPNAKNPNFLQILKIPVDLPTKKLFAPFIDIEIKDTMFGGLVKRLIGTASIDLGRFMMDEQGRWATDKEVKVLEEDDLLAEIEAEALGLGDVGDDDEQKVDDDEDDEDEEHVGSSSADEHLSREQSRPLLFTGSQSHEDVIEMASRGGKNKGAQPLSSSVTETHPSEVVMDDDDEKYDDEEDGDEAGGNARPAGNVAVPVTDEFVDEEDEAFEQDELRAVTSDTEDEDDQPAYMKGRRTVDNELEDVMVMEPFHTIPLWTGQENAGAFSQSLTQVGRFKGLIRLTEDKDSKSEIDTGELMMPKELFLRLYILRGTKLIPQDSDGNSDPYLIIKVGKQKYSTRDRYIKDCLEPDFYEAFEIPVTIPGDAEVKIRVMDWDGIGDDLIGETIIDIEDRWFCKDWRALPLKPVEWRTLHSPTSTAPQGKLQMWVEILDPLEAKRSPLLNIKPPPPSPFELRVIVWGLREVPNHDETTEMNDLYVTCATNIPGQKKQETDTHLRAQGGKGNFNWRMKFPLLLSPQTKPWPRIRFQVWDRDFLSANDSICEIAISLKGLCKQALKKKDRVKLLVKGKERFWLEPLRHPNFEEDQGRMEISVELMPESVASQIPAGYGRGNPNQNPVLPEPEGRMKWTLNPFTMLRQILGDKICFKCFCIILVALIGGAISMVAPMIFSNMVSSALTP